jgi:predicted transcriptional regulator
MVFEKRRGRDRLHIVAEILEIAKEGALKTQVMYRANLSFAQLIDYLRLMLKINLLEKVEINGKEVYKASEKGLDFLQRYREINELLRLEREKSSNEEGMMSIQLEEKGRLTEQGTA